MNLHVVPSRGEFGELAKRGNLVPLRIELVADVETPVSAFAKLDDGRPCFLFESAERSEESGRFSFVGSEPLLIFKKNGTENDPLGALQIALDQFKFVSPFPSSHFVAGAVGYIGYDMVRSFERSVPVHPQDDLRLPAMMFMVPRIVLIFDHRLRKLHLVANAYIEDAGSVDQAYNRAKSALEQTIAQLRTPLALPPISSEKLDELPPLQSNTTASEFESMVREAKELIAAGDIYQIVLSQRFETTFSGNPLDLYRALRFGNPSPYMFCLKFDDGFAAVGSSPEMHVRVRGRTIEVRPIAGTRRRGNDPVEDEQLAAELLADPKERAEHVMLIDLGRNDVGRVSEFGTVRVTEQMAIERYSHVMHIVSHVVGQLRSDQDAFDAIRATFPAGTVSGAPKIRAMQIIAQLEKARRGFYSGIVGYFGFDGSHNSCIAIRSIVLTSGKAYFQTGAGIVADSDPAREHFECISKSKAMLEALARASEIAK